MNYQNAIVITAALIIWSQIVNLIVPSTVGRTIIGILGSVLIGAAFALSGISVIGA